MTIDDVDEIYELLDEMLSDEFPWFIGMVAAYWSDVWNTQQTFSLPDPDAGPLFGTIEVTESSQSDDQENPDMSPRTKRTRSLVANGTRWEEEPEFACPKCSEKGRIWSQVFDDRIEGKLRLSLCCRMSFRDPELVQGDWRAIDEINLQLAREEQATRVSRHLERAYGGKVAD